MEYQVMGKINRFVRKKNCIPTKFDCQPDRMKRMSSPIAERSAVIKRRKLTVLNDAVKRVETVTREITPPPSPPPISLEMPCAGIPTYQPFIIIYCTY